MSKLPINDLQTDNVLLKGPPLELRALPWGPVSGLGQNYTAPSHPGRAPSGLGSKLLVRDLGLVGQVFPFADRS